MIKVDENNCHELVLQYIKKNKINVINYIETMTDIYLKMLKENYCFILNRDLLNAILVDIAYQQNPYDDFNKDNVLQISLNLTNDSDSDDEDDEDDVDDDEIDNNGNDCEEHDDNNKNNNKITLNIK